MFASAHGTDRRRDRDALRPRGDRGDRGQALPLVLAVAALVVVLMMGLARFGARVIAHEQAQVAADAAALAGVDGGEVAAKRFAVANGAVLVSFTRDATSVLVVVEVAGERATARAGRRGVGAP